MSSPIIGSPESSGDENRVVDTMDASNKPQFKTVLEAAAAPRPRLCHLKKWPHFQGYGFNLHAEKSKLSQHIGKVDQGSPAESAGLREGDRIIEVNNVNISNENHQQVVKRIRNGLEREGAIHDDEVLLLVIDRDGEDYYRNMNVVIKSDFDNVIQLKTADPPPPPSIQTEEKGEEEPVPSPRHKKLNSPSLSSSSTSPRSDTASPKHNVDTNKPLVIPSPPPPPPPPQPTSSSSLVMSSSSLSSPSSTSSSKNNTPNPNSTTSSSTSSKASTSKSNNNNNRVINNANNNSIASSPASTVSINTPTTTSRTGTLNNSINNKDNSSIGSALIQDPYKMTASEFKNYLKSKSRVDPRVTPLDMRRKHEIFQNM